MNVFTPAQARSATEERVAKDALRARGLAETTKELLQTKEEVEQEFQDMLKRHQEEQEIVFSENTKKRDSLFKEVEQLEARRKEALSPLLIKEEDIHTVQEALKARELRVQARAEQTEEESRLLMLKLDDVSNREADIIKKEKKALVSEKAIETMKIQASEGVKLLNEKIAAFQVHKNEQEFEFARRASELDAQKSIHEEKNHSLIAREQELESAKRLLTEHRSLLDSEHEGKNKNHSEEESRLAKIENSLNQREQDILEKEDAQQKEQHAFDKKAHALTAREKQQGSKEEIFSEKVEQTEEAFAYRQSELDATANLQAQKEEAFKKRELANQDERRQIADQRLLLDKGFKELRTKQK